MPVCHPTFGIPYTPGRGNHTPEFMKRARAPEAHEEAFKTCVGMALVGMRVLTDKQFLADVSRAHYLEGKGKY